MNTLLAQDHTLYYRIQTEVTPPGYDPSVWEENWNQFWHNFAVVAGCVAPFLIAAILFAIVVHILAIRYNNKLPDDGGDE